MEANALNFRRVRELREQTMGGFPLRTHLLKRPSDNVKSPTPPPPPRVKLSKPFLPAPKARIPRGLIRPLPSQPKPAPMPTPAAPNALETLVEQVWQRKSPGSWLMFKTGEVVAASTGSGFWKGAAELAQGVSFGYAVLKAIEGLTKR